MAAMLTELLLAILYQQTALCTPATKVTFVEIGQVVQPSASFSRLEEVFESLFHIFGRAVVLMT